MADLERNGSGNDRDMRVHDEERLIGVLHEVIRWSIRGLACLMTVVILFGVLDVVWLMYGRLTTDPVGILEITDILEVFGAFLAVLIAVEIFINITVYLRDDVIHVKIVMATALMAIARKVIILDYKSVDPMYVFATAAVVLAMSIGYWLAVVWDQKRTGDSAGH